MSKQRPQNNNFSAILGSSGFKTEQKSYGPRGGPGNYTQTPSKFGTSGAYSALPKRY